MKSPMKSPFPSHGIGIRVASADLPRSYVSYSEPNTPYPASSPCGSPESKQKKKDSVIHWVSKLSKKADSYVQGIREHVTLAPRISDTMKGKLNLSARIIHAGGVEKFFRQSFVITEGERLQKASQCYLSTTAGPVSGMLFISTDKIAFHSDKSIRLGSSKGSSTRLPYKVLIPIKRIERATSSKNSDKPNQKYIQIVTVDDFEFWFMGFISYGKSFKHLKLVTSEFQSVFQNGRTTCG